MKFLHTLKTNKAEVLLASVLLFILLSPVAAELSANRFVVSALSLPVMIVAAFYASRSKPHCTIAVVIAAAWFCLSFLIPNTTNTVWPYLLYGLLLGFVTYTILGQILRAKTVDRSLIASAITVYLLLGTSWGAVFMVVYLANPAAFHAPDVDPHYASIHFLYYSYVTLTTLGYGDITPISPTARILSVVEAITGVLYVAVLIARLVSLIGHDIRKS